MDSLPLKKRLFSPKAEISRLDELIAHSRSEREKAHAILRREQKEAQDHANYETWRLAHPPPPPNPSNQPLEEDDLYLDDARPGDILLPQLEHTCRLCLNAKSHPVK
ncbi:hypothetical protein B0H14DRAFT_3514549 [Mycena olivaceomarginata]|nr:hypothetical protein B0H14DRAFT_3514549 [Mycena olivaceomarginata]